MKDSVTGFSGTITGRAEYLTGCRQYCLVPPVDDKGNPRAGEWFDEDRLAVKDKTSTEGGPQQYPAPSQ